MIAPRAQIRTWEVVTGGDSSWLSGSVRSRCEEMSGSEVPVLLLDPCRGADIADELRLRLGKVYYAIKAGPYEPLIAELAKRGHGMDIASVAEAVLALGHVGPGRVICTNPVLPGSQLAELISLGVSVFVVDDVGQAQILKDSAGGFYSELSILVRVGWHDVTAGAVLAEKFGVGEDEVAGLVTGVRGLGLRVAGLSFHLGSQAQSLTTANEVAGSALALAESCGIEDPVIDVGGGFPVAYQGAGASWEQFTEALAGPLVDKTTVWCEPGRVIASAGTWLVASVIGVATRRGKRFVHLNAGAYQGLLEASGHSGTALIPPSALWAEPGVSVPARLTGPTCDSSDMVFPFEVQVSSNTKAGDVIVFYLAGAYATSCSTTFNGFSGPIIEEIAS